VHAIASPPLSVRPLLVGGAGALVVAAAVRGIDVGALGAVHVDARWVVASLVLNLASLLLKAFVWKAALDALPGLRLRLAPVVSALLVGALLNTVLFARLGDVARVTLLARDRRASGQPLDAAAVGGSVLAEQLVLGVTLAALLAGAALVLPLPALVLQLLVAFVALLALLGGAVALVPHARGRGTRLAATFAGSGRALAQRPALAARALAAGLASWLAQVLGIAAALAAFGIQASPGAAALVFAASTLVQLFPFWPGNVGAFQLGIVAPLGQAYGVDGPHAVAFAVGLQAIEAGLAVGLGLVCLWRSGLTFGELRAWLAPWRRGDRASVEVGGRAAAA
jgi:uncharacterized membrane protein YbhN (UPF0104 family)